MKKKHLSISEKRDWLANLFRDASGEISQAEKFKAMVEDTRLAMLPDPKEASKDKDGDPLEKLRILEKLPAPLKE